MKIIDTSIRTVETRKTDVLNYETLDVTMTIADADRLEDAKSYITFRIQFEHTEAPLFAEVQAIALERARSVIAEERKALLTLAQQAR